MEHYFINLFILYIYIFMYFIFYVFTAQRSLADNICEVDENPHRYQQRRAWHQMEEKTPERE